MVFIFIIFTNYYWVTLWHCELTTTEQRAAPYEDFPHHRLGSTVRLPASLQGSGSALPPTMQGE